MVGAKDSRFHRQRKLKETERIQCQSLNPNSYPARFAMGGAMSETQYRLGLGDVSYIFCSCCFVSSIEFFSLSEAIAAWNRRVNKKGR
jgi:hypothetical protein